MDDGQRATTGGRLESLDALRGFDMFFITGGAGLVVALCGALGWGDGWLAGQMDHVEWAGLAHHDTIFPLFLYLAGVTWPFSLAAQLARGRTARQIRRKVLVRAATLFLIGMSFGGVLRFDPHFRIPSVLGQIGVSWGIAALVFLHARRTWPRLAVAGAMLVGYWALLRFIPAPDAVAGADAFSLDGNVISWLDRVVMPNHVYVTGRYDPESLFAFAPGAALALFGMSAGDLLRREGISGGRKTATLFAAAGALLAATLLFTGVLGVPIVKKLWTSSFVLAAAAYSTAMLALFHWLVDVKGWRNWAFYFRVIGKNSITIYVIMMLGVLELLTRFLFGGLAAWVGGAWAGVVTGFGTLATGWAILYVLYRHKVFLRV